jgi:hypothetical protein
MTLPQQVIDKFVARCRRERAEAGLPAHLTDPAVLDTVAALFVTGITERERRKRWRRRVTLDELFAGSVNA